MSKSVKDGGPVYRCPCCSSVLELRDGSLRKVPTDPHCKKCGHTRGNHLPGYHCVSRDTDEWTGSKRRPRRVQSETDCGCPYFHDDPGLIERAMRGQG